MSIHFSLVQTAGPSFMIENFSCPVYLVVKNKDEYERDVEGPKGGVKCKGDVIMLYDALVL